MARMSDEKKGFFLYNDYIEHVSLMSDEDAGKLLKAILSYENGIDVGDISGIAAMAFSFIKAQLDRDADKYDDICKRNRENGKKGGRPRKVVPREENQDVKPKASGNSVRKSETDQNPKKPDGFLEGENETAGNPSEPKKPDTDTETETDINKKTYAHPTRSKEFEEWWKEYPRKDDKGMAYAKYQARIKDGFSHEELLQAARCYSEQCRMRHTERQYIKQAKTFLSDKLPFTDYLPREENGTIDNGYGEVDFADYMGG